MLHSTPVGTSGPARTCGPQLRCKEHSCCLNGDSRVAGGHRLPLPARAPLAGPRQTFLCRLSSSVLMSNDGMRHIRLFQVGDLVLGQDHRPPPLGAHRPLLLTQGPKAVHAAKRRETTSQGVTEYGRRLFRVPFPTRHSRGPPAFVQAETHDQWGRAAFLRRRAEHSRRAVRRLRA